MSLSAGALNRPLTDLSEGEAPRRVFLALVALLFAGWSVSLAFVHTSPEWLCGAALSGVCVLIFVLALFRLDWACCVFILVMPVQIVTFWPVFGGLRDDERMTPYHLATAALALGALLNLLARAEGTPLRIRRPLFLVFLWAVASLTWAPDKPKAIAHLLWMTSSLAVYHVVLPAARSRRTLLRMVNVWILVALVAAVIGIIAVWVDWFVFTEHVYGGWIVRILNRAPQGRRAGGIDTPTELSFFCYLPLFWCLGRFFERKRLRYLLLVLVLGIAVRLTEKRMAQFATVGALFVFFYYEPRLRRHFLHFTIPILLFAAACFYAGNYFSGRWDYERYAQAFSSSEKKQSITSRLKNYKTNLRLNFKYYAGMGIGIGGNSLLLKRSGTPTYEHNLYLSEFSDLGPVGLTIMLFFWIRETCRLMRLVRQVQDRQMQLLGAAFVAGIAAIAMHGVLDLHYYAFLELWFYFGLAGGFIEIAGRELAAGPPPAPAGLPA